MSVTWRRTMDVLGVMVKSPALSQDFPQVCKCEDEGQHLQGKGRPQAELKEGCACIHIHVTRQGRKRRQVGTSSGRQDIHRLPAECQRRVVPACACGDGERGTCCFADGIPHARVDPLPFDGLQGGFGAHAAQDPWIDADLAHGICEGWQIAPSCEQQKQDGCEQTPAQVPE